MIPSRYFTGEYVLRVPHARCLSVGLFGLVFVSRHAARTEANLRVWPPALYHVQLLPAAAAPCVSASARHIRSVPRSGKERVRIQAGWVCRHAGARSSVDFRTGTRDSFDRCENAEAARVTRTHRQPSYVQDTSPTLTKRAWGTRNVRTSGLSVGHPPMPARHSPSVTRHSLALSAR